MPTQLPLLNLSRWLTPVLGVLLMLAAMSCDRAKPGTASQPTAAKVDRVVSLSPAATDLLVAMGAQSKLVAVSNYESLEAVKGLPRAGDYLNIDWEKLVSLRPQLMVLQIDEARLSDATRARAREMGIELLIVRLNNFTDVIIEAEKLGTAVGMADESRTLWQSIRQNMDDVRLSTAELPRVRTLVTLDDSGLFLAGRGTFINDILQAAGGVNVLSAERGDYVTLDEEAVRQLAPDAVIQLMPVKEMSLALAQSAKFRERFADMPAVKSGRVYVYADPRALTPASNLGAMAKWMGEQLHPDRDKPSNPSPSR